MIVDFANSNGFTIKYIFVTHDHPDHTNGNDEARRLTRAEAMQAPELRPYRESDFTACAELWERCGLSTWYNRPDMDIARWLDSPNGEILVLADDGAWLIKRCRVPTLPAPSRP